MANPWPWLSTKLTSNAASSLHRVINSASLERQVSSSKIVEPTGSRLPKRGNSPYRPPLVLPGGPSQTTKETPLGISVTGARYQSQSSYPISGEKQPRTPAMRLRVRTSCTAPLPFSRMLKRPDFNSTTSAEETKKERCRTTSALQNRLVRCDRKLCHLFKIFEICCVPLISPSSQQV